MSNRDEFSRKTKNAVALRANQHCSFRGCPQSTSGPSEESPEAVNMTGRAVHIHGAASGPGSRRYLASMTREQRIDISNAIVRDLASFFRRVWAQGQAGVDVPVSIYRDGDTLDVRVKSSERNRFLKGPSLH